MNWIMTIGLNLTGIGIGVLAVSKLAEWEVGVSLLVIGVVVAVGWLVWVFSPRYQSSEQVL